MDRQTLLAHANARAALMLHLIVGLALASWLLELALRYRPVWLPVAVALTRALWSLPRYLQARLRLRRVNRAYRRNQGRAIIVRAAK